MNGVTSVDDSGVKIEPRKSKGERQEREYAPRSDSEIKKAIRLSLHLDPRVSAFSPAVTVEDGMVRLRGTVGNLKAKSSAEWDAENIVGVVRVDDLLKVRPKARLTDAETEKQIKAALLSDSLLDGSKIDVAVRKCVVTLSGEMDSNFLKTEAQDVASRTKGVLSVHNHLKVGPEASSHHEDYPLYGDSFYVGWPYYYPYLGWPYDNESLKHDSGIHGLQLHMTDAQIKKSIKDGFFWSPFVDSDDVKVTVKGGEATLTGTVGTRIGWGEANRDAYEGGATKVENQVKVTHRVWWWWW